MDEHKGPLSGYIGGTVLLRFLTRSDAASLNITALVRSPDKAEQLKALGVNGVVGSFSDLSLIEKLASETDVVIAMVCISIIYAARILTFHAKPRLMLITSTWLKLR